MDAKEYVRRLSAIGRELQNDSRFKTVFELYPAFSDTDFEELEEALEREGLPGYRIPRVFRDLYGAAGGFVLQWQNLRPGAAAVSTGSTRIAIVPAIFLPEGLPAQQGDRLFKEPRVWDAVGPDEHAALRFHKDRQVPELLYFADATRKYHPLSLNVETYLETLLEARAMYQWQQFFVDDPEFPLSRDHADRFRGSLKALFPDADTSRFAGKQER